MNTDLRDSTLKRKRQEYLDITVIYSEMLVDSEKNMNDNELITFKQISVDIPRTMSEYSLFTHTKIRKRLTRLLFIWAKRHPASGYVQGLNDLAATFFAVFLIDYINFSYDNLAVSHKVLDELEDNKYDQVEADSYWCFKKMMDNIQTNYTFGQPGIKLMMDTVEETVKLVNNSLYVHLKKHDVKNFQYMFRWMNCYLMREFSLQNLIRIWDSYFAFEESFNFFHLFVCSSLLLNYSNKLKSLDEFQEIIMFLLNMPTSEWSLEDIDVLIAKSYQIYVIYGKKIKQIFDDLMIKHKDLNLKS